MPCKMKNAVFFALLSAFAFPLAAQANDSIASVSPEGLKIERSDTLRMKKERLSITPKSVEVDYVFFNESDRDITTEVAFPLPEVGDSYRTNQHSFDDFSVWVEGKKVAFQKQNRALDKDDNDITEKVEKAGLPLDRFLAFDQLSSAQKEAAIAQDLYNTHNPDEEMQPYYFLKRTMHWTQLFPAHRALSIKHSYTPVLGSNSIMDMTYSEAWAHLYPQTIRPAEACCLSSRYEGWEPASCPRFVTTPQKDDIGGFKAEYLNYILSTGSNWKNGIEDFSLTLSGARVIFVQMDDAYDVGLGEISLTRTNFHPSKELLVEFVDVGKAPRLPPYLNVVKQTATETPCTLEPEGRTSRTLPAHEVVSLKEARGAWLKISDKNETCWVKKEALTPASCP